MFFFFSFFLFFFVVFWENHGENITFAPLLSPSVFTPKSLLSKKKEMVNSV